MKTLLSSLFIALCIVTFSSAQVIPNRGFEDWYPYTSGEYPTAWTTSDSLAAALGGPGSVTKDADAFDGNFSIRMKSITTTFGITGPGVATNGLVSFSGSNFIFSGGSPDTARSRFFNGWYKYAPTNVLDAAVVKVYLLKNNLGVRDTIAEAVQELSSPASAWTPFVMMMIYRNFLVQPDTCLIILQSSRGLNDPTLGIGTLFNVDSLGFSGFVGLDELHNNINSVNIFPSPANNSLTIDIDFKTKMRLNYEMYDINGRLVRNGDLQDTKEQVNVSELSAGKYILLLNDEKKNQVYNTTFSIAR